MENINIIKANINNLTSLWKEVANVSDTCYLSDDFNYCRIKKSDWPNRLWFTKTITKGSLVAAKDIVSSSKETLTIPYWEIDNSASNGMLKIAGFKEKSEQVGMSLKLSSHYKTHFRLHFERIANPEQAKMWAELYPNAFGYSISEEIIRKSYGIVEYYLASRYGEPVGTAMVYQTGDIAGIHGVGVSPEMRRQGFAEEIMMFALNRSIDLKASHVTLQASAMGKGLYDKLGFKENFNIKNYILETDS